MTASLWLATGLVCASSALPRNQLRLEHARDLPQPRFISGDLAECPIGGGAIGGGMGRNRAADTGLTNRCDPATVIDIESRLMRTPTAARVESCPFAIGS